MAVKTHTISSRFAQNEANAAPANVNACTVAASVISLSGSGLSTLTATVTNSTGVTPGATATASAISGNAATITIGGTPKFGDDIAVVLNGIGCHIPGSPTLGTAAHASALCARLNAKIKGDILNFLASDKNKTSIASASSGDVTTYGIPLGSKYNLQKDTRPTTTDTLTGQFPTSWTNTVKNDVET